MATLEQQRANLRQKLLADPNNKKLRQRLIGINDQLRAGGADIRSKVAGAPADAGGGSTATTIKGKAKDATKGALDIAVDQMNQYDKFDPNLTERVGGADLEADRSRIEESVFGRLTRDLDKNYQREREQTLQELANRGVDINNPNDPTYQRFMGDLQQRYADQRLDARGQAVQMGGEEYSRDFGINEQRIANEFAQQQGTHAQNVGDINTFANIGQTGQNLLAGIRDANLRRQLEKYIANLQSSTSLGVAGIGANAAIQAAKINNEDDGIPDFQ